MTESQLTKEQKLVWLGLRQPTKQEFDGQQIAIDLQEAFGGDWDDFLSAYEDANISNFNEFEQFLIDNGISERRAQTIRNNFENKFDSFSEFDSFIKDTDSYNEFNIEYTSSNEFRSDITNEVGRSAAGIKVYESAGVGRNGQEIPQGGTEIWGKEVYISESVADPDNDDPGDSDGETTFEFQYSNLTVSDTAVEVAETLTVECDIENISSQTRQETVQLYIDDIVRDAKASRLRSGQGATVSFEIDFTEYGQYEVTIGPLSPKTITVIHPSL